MKNYFRFLLHLLSGLRAAGVKALVEVFTFFVIVVFIIVSPVTYPILHVREKRARKAAVKKGPSRIKKAPNASAKKVPQRRKTVKKTARSK